MQRIIQELTREQMMEDLPQVSFHLCYNQRTRGVREINVSKIDPDSFGRYFKSNTGKSPFDIVVLGEGEDSTADDERIIVCKNVQDRGSFTWKIGSVGKETLLKKYSATATTMSRGHLIEILLANTNYKQYLLEAHLKQVRLDVDCSFSPGDKIGQGSFGKVYLSTYNEQEVAVKVLNRSTLSGDCWMQEISSHQQLQLACRRIADENDDSNDPKKYFVHFIGCRYEFNSSFSEMNSVYLVFELMHQDAESYVLSPDYNRDNIYNMVKSVVRAVAILHTHANMLHCDISANNVLITKTGEAKLADLGLAISMDSASYGARGTLCYMAPELTADKNETNTIASDVYSTALVAYLLTSKIKPNHTLTIPAEAEEYHPKLSALIKWGACVFKSDRATSTELDEEMRTSKEVMSEKLVATSNRK